MARKLLNDDDDGSPLRSILLLSLVIGSSRAALDSFMAAFPY